MTATQRHAGLLVHQLVGEIAGLGNSAPPPPEVLIERAAAAVKANPFPATERYGVIRVAGAVRIALDMSPVGWQFLGCEVPAGRGRVDLVWGEPGRWGRVLIDEMKLAGFTGVVDDPTTHAQVLRYLTWGAGEFGNQFAGVRVLALSAPRRSLLFKASDPHTPSRLVGSDLWWAPGARSEVS